MSPIDVHIKEMKDAVTRELLEFVYAHRGAEFGDLSIIPGFGTDSRCTNWGVRFNTIRTDGNLLYLVYDHAAQQWGLSYMMNHIKVSCPSKDDALNMFKFCVRSIQTVRRFQVAQREAPFAQEPQLPAELRPLMLR